MCSWAVAVYEPFTWIKMTGSIILEIDLPDTTKTTDTKISLSNSGRAALNGT